MNKPLFCIYRLYQYLGDYIYKHGVDSAIVKYKHKHRRTLTMAEQCTVLIDVDKVKYGEMSLSEYIDKWGTVFVDEHFQKLFIQERPKNK